MQSQRKKIICESHSHDNNIISTATKTEQAEHSESQLLAGQYMSYSTSYTQIKLSKTTDKNVKCIIIIINVLIKSDTRSCIKHYRGTVQYITKQHETSTSSRWTSH